MEKGAEDDEALNVTEIFYNRVADHIRNQPDAARSYLMRAAALPWQIVVQM